MNPNKGYLERNLPAFPTGMGTRIGNEFRAIRAFVAKHFQP